MIIGYPLSQFSHHPTVGFCSFRTSSTISFRVFAFVGSVSYNSIIFCCKSIKKFWKFILILFLPLSIYILFVHLLFARVLQNTFLISRILLWLVWHVSYNCHHLLCIYSCSAFLSPLEWNLVISHTIKCVYVCWFYWTLFLAVCKFVCIGYYACVICFYSIFLWCWCVYFPTY